MLLALPGWAACSGDGSGAAAGSQASADVLDTGGGGFNFDSAGQIDTAKPVDAVLGGTDAAVLDGAVSDATLVDGAAGDGGPTDAVLAGQFGAPCDDAGDCDSGYCVESAAGKVCSKPCAGSCPAGWACALMPSASGDSQNVCLPLYARLCDPCSTANDCNSPGLSGGLCLGSGENGQDGSFCAIACTPGETDPCPDGYACKAASNGHACQPLSGQCACSPSAAAKELQTTCSVPTALGVCKGMRSCKGGVLSACSAGKATPEVCNGIDDDCDGQTDDIAPAPCSKQNEFGTCSGSTIGCQGGDSLCGASTPAPETCNALDDDCDGQTDEGLCEDGNPCTAGSCNPDGSCQQQPVAAQPCNDGNACTQTDFCAQGQCQGGDAKLCDDGNPCTTDACDAVQGCVSVSAPPAAPCSDDGNPCTQDVCQGTQCSHPFAKLGTACSDDGDACTSDVCDGGGLCSHPIGLGLCKVGGQCVPAGTASPANPCLVCDPSVTSAAYVPKDGIACSDGDPCTVNDKCVAGSCNGSPKSCAALDSACSTGACQASDGACVAKPKAAGVSCDDGNGCTNKDVCDGKGGCGGAAVSCAALTDTCNTGVCSNGQCLAQAKPSGTACSDGDPCTLSDKCNGTGECKGTAKDCSSLTDACNTGLCSNGTCSAKPKADNTLCSDGSSCTSGDKCQAGVCKGTYASDAFEANNVSLASYQLQSKSDCDGASNLSAAMNPTDIDWYTFEASDNSFCTIKPNAKIDTMSGDYDVCVYFTCKGQSPTSGMVSCSAGTKTSSGSGPMGAFGCCSTNAGTLSDFAKISPSCSTGGLGSESGTVWVKVTPKAGATCGSYVLSYAAKDL